MLSVCKYLLLESDENFLGKQKRSETANFADPATKNNINTKF